MFGTSLHWATFFFVLVDVLIVAVFLINYARNPGTSKRFLLLGALFIIYTLFGGLFPLHQFPGPLILQYILLYSLGIGLCIYLILYLYADFNIRFHGSHASIKNLTFLSITLFAALFLIPYFLTGSIELARKLFTIPISFIAISVLWMFYNRISNLFAAKGLTAKRNTLSLICICSVVLLPIMVVIRAEQWLIFFTINLAFYSLTCMEIERYLYYLENKYLLFRKAEHLEIPEKAFINSNIIYYNLSPRELEIALLILGKESYKRIGAKLHIAECTVSKHASNIFKKTETRNKTEFLERFNHLR